MPSPSFVALSTITLASADSSIVFSNIPNTYRDLSILIEARATTSNELRMRLNGDSGNNYPWTQFLPTTSNVGTFSAYPISPNSFLLSTQSAVMTVDIMNYATNGTTKAITSNFRDYGTSQNINIMGGVYNGTSPVTSIEIFMLGNSFEIGSTFSLYGV